ncbi:MAG: TraB/GumN family protein [Bacteroidota bacterium]|jgi:uncharacterized protein YbaP (TraB family)
MLTRFLTILFLGSILHCGAQQDFPMKESALLWKIEGPGVKKGCYLFGTMHLIEKEYFLFPKKLEKLVEQSELLVMEIAELPGQAEAVKYVTLQEGTFFDFFTKEQTDTILTWAKEKLFLDETAFRNSMSQMKPFVVVQLATQLYFMGKTESYETSFEAIAKKNGIERMGLETVAQQMGFFDRLQNDEEAEMVMESIRNGDKSIQDVKKMQSIYAAQQVDSLYLMIIENGGVVSEEQAAFLDDRNMDWIPKIEGVITEKRAFIAVGAGHLGGPKGVIRLLRQKGYTITPVRL